MVAYFCGREQNSFLSLHEKFTTLVGSLKQAPKDVQNVLQQFHKEGHVCSPILSWYVLDKKQIAGATDDDGPLSCFCWLPLQRAWDWGSSVGWIWNDNASWYASVATRRSLVLWVGDALEKKKVAISKPLSVLAISLIFQNLLVQRATSWNHPAPTQIRQPISWCRPIRQRVCEDGTSEHCRAYRSCGMH